MYIYTQYYYNRHWIRNLENAQKFFCFSFHFVPFHKHIFIMHGANSNVNFLYFKCHYGGGGEGGDVLVHIILIKTFAT